MFGKLYAIDCKEEDWKTYIQSYEIDWLRVLQLDWAHLHQLNKASEKWQEVVERHANVFQQELGRVQGVKVKIHVDPKAQLKFYRPVTFPTH